MIRICKDRNILKQYLSSKEVEVVTIMMIPRIDIRWHRRN